MAATFTAPGVYIQEIPSGNRTITGVSTSLTAFVGPTLRGPTNTPTRVNSWAEFQRSFGGLWASSTMTQAVRHYFLNGGAEALIVRVVNASANGTEGAATASADVGIGMHLYPTSDVLELAGFDHLVATVANSTGETFDLEISAVDAADAVIDDGGGDPHTITLNDLNVTADYRATINAAVTGTAPPIALVNAPHAAPTARPVNGNYASTDEGALGLSSETLSLEAANEGEWGNRLQAQPAYADTAGGEFHLRIAEVTPDGETVAEEFHYNLTTDALGARSVERVLEQGSDLARVGAAVAATAPVEGVEPVPFTQGRDGDAPRVTEDIQGADGDERTGIFSLLEADLFNLLCIPLNGGWASTDAGAQNLWDAASQLCEQERAFLIVDPPSDWGDAAAAEAGLNTLTIARSANAAMYFPNVRVPNPLTENRLVAFPPCGVVAGAVARTDAQRGIWKAPAGIEVNLNGVPEVALPITDAQQGVLNQLGLNVIRAFPVYGRVLWGARTLDGADVLASDWKYVPVRRLALYLEESLVRGTRWAVFEPNDEPLWSQLRLGIGSFMQGLFRQGAFQGATASDAYFVKCDAETTTQNDVDRGIVNVVIGFAPLKPAEFVVIQIQQMTARSE